MKKYCKVVNDETKQVIVGIGDNVDYYKSIGFIEQEVIEVNNIYYLDGYEPKPDMSELKKEKKDILTKNIELAIYGEYPQYRQNNIAIFGTKEEKQEFKDFYELMVNEFKNRITAVDKVKSINSLEKIDNNFDIEKIINGSKENAE